MSIKEKIETIAHEVYGAGTVTYTEDASDAIEKFTSLGYGNLPICMAKTHLSLSHDPTVKGAPKGFTFPVKDLRLAAGAGFIYPLTGEISTMPGLPSVPAYMGMDIDTTTGMITGLS
jgi:formyltetrahydrofolate synthetase